MRTSKIDLDVVNSLLARGCTYAQIAETIGVPRGTLSAFLSRRGIKKGRATVTPVITQVAPVKQKTIEDFSPRELIKRLYQLGYRIENNSLVVITKQKVNIMSVINE